MRKKEAEGKHMLKVAHKNELPEYILGEQQQRPWGHYKVIDLGVDENNEAFCYKEITVEPGHILSLQSHQHRREEWTVKEGKLIVILEDQKYILTAGQTIKIPLQSIHCMANGGKDRCIVFEKQIGLCSEDDIIRYVDVYGRGTMLLNTRSRASADLFNQVKKEIAQ